MFQLDRFIPISKLKYYFAVDTVYVGKKLGLLVFPYMHEVSLLNVKYSVITASRKYVDFSLWAFVYVHQT